LPLFSLSTLYFLQMSIPLVQAWSVARHVIRRRLRGEDRFPLVLMLEVLFRCNLACGGCGKIQHPATILRRQLTPEECFRAVEECGAPIVSIPGGEPLLHPQIDAIVSGLVERRRFVYLCTNALLLKGALGKFTPSPYLVFSVHLDGPREVHDRAVCREGVFDEAVAAIRAARNRGFRVTTNTTLFADADPARIRDFFDEVMALGVDGMMVSPAYSYARAPDQDRFPGRAATVRLFRDVLSAPRPGWRFHHSPLFLKFLQGEYSLDCTPWGNPTYNVLGWQRPCYLLDGGHCATFQELLDATDWSRYGPQSGNAACRDCMVHSGYEPSAVLALLGSWTGLWATLRRMLSESIRARTSGPKAVDMESGRAVRLPIVF
jgi:hopanoid biosynthesis associated radical SAM protein HpnH